MVIKERFFIIVLILLLISACTNNSDNKNPADNPDDSSQTSELDKALNSTFRIDISSIKVEFDYTPENYHVKGRATVQFIMREGQTKPLIHFNPGVRDRNSIKLLKLNSETLDIQKDLTVKTFTDTKQKALEFNKSLSSGVTHTLYMEYELALKRDTQIFITDVNDINGVGNEELFPTINSPQELADHEIKFKNLGSENLRIIGSGNITQNRNSEGQEWTLKPVRAISSYTLMFALVPESDVDYMAKTIGGVKVEMIAYKGSELFDKAIEILEECLPEYQKYLGTFPMPEGLSLFLTAGGGGMEYYGGSITSNFALRHEVFHMYFACSVVMKTYRDSWLDEAITSWYDRVYELRSLGDGGGFPSGINEDYRSNIVSGRSFVEVGFDTRAYNDGSRIIASVSNELGVGRGKGVETMMAFLKYICDNYRFKPFTTMEFVEYFKTYSGIDMNNRFKQWLFSEERRKSRATSADYKKLMPDLTPPAKIRDKYSLNH